MFRKASFQSKFGAALGIISWVAPLGVSFALAAILFGIMGLLRNTSKDTAIIVFSLLAIFLGSSSRLVYAFMNHTGEIAAVIITIIAITVTVVIFIKKKFLQL